MHRQSCTLLAPDDKTRELGCTCDIGHLEEELAFYVLELEQRLCDALRPAPPDRRIAKGRFEELALFVLVGAYGALVGTIFGRKSEWR